MWWDQVAQLLEERIGLDAQTVGRQLIETAVRRRVAALGLDGPAAYPEQLQSAADEVAALVEEVVIPESWFFRDGRPFVRLQEFARATATPVFRVLSIPCAGGEEAYSIALALREAGLEAARLRIDAVDVSARLIAQARQGLFRRNALRGEHVTAYLRSFRERPDGWELDPQVRDLVRFSRGNLLDPDLLRGEPAYDVIFCRNLLIYLTDAARQRALANLDRLLAPGGVLFVGHAEAVGLLQPRFIPDGDRGSFALRRAPAAALPPPVPTPPARPTVPVRARTAPRAAEPPAPTVPAETDLLGRAERLANAKQHAEASRLCEQALCEQGPSARAFGLLGMIDLATGATDRAEANLLKAVYLDPAAADALLALALISQGRGDDAAAERYRGRARRAEEGR